MKKRIAFDLDETLGVALVDTKSLQGFELPGCVELLQRLESEFQLVLWSSSERGYVDRCETGLERFFVETYTWQEFPIDGKTFALSTRITWSMTVNTIFSRPNTDLKAATSPSPCTAQPKTLPIHSDGRKRILTRLGLDL